MLALRGVQRCESMSDYQGSDKLLFSNQGYFMQVIGFWVLGCILQIILLVN